MINANSQAEIIKAETGFKIRGLRWIIIGLVFFATLIVLLVMTVMGVTNHMGWEMFPRALVHSKVGEWLITASHHQRHHDLYRCNYGLYFRFWDKVCGTDRGLV